MLAFSRELVITVPDMSCEHCREAVTIVSEDVREAIAAAGYTPTLRSP